MSDFVTDNALLKRAYIFLEDGEWTSADEYFERVLDSDPECAQAYLGKLLVDLKITGKDALKTCVTRFKDNKNYNKVLRYGSDELKAEIEEYANNVDNNIEVARKDSIINNVRNSMQNSSKWVAEDYDRAISLLKTISGYKNADDLIVMCNEKKAEFYQKVEIAKKENILASVLNSLKKSNGWGVKEYDRVIEILHSLKGFKNSAEIIAFCEEQKNIVIKRIEDARIEAERIAEEKRKEAERIAEEKRIEAEKRAEKRKENIKKLKKILIIIGIVAVLVVAGFFAVTKLVIPAIDYNKAVEHMNNKEYDKAMGIFKELNGFKDSEEKIKEVQFLQATDLMNSGKHDKAKEIFAKISDYKNSADMIKECMYLKAGVLYDKGKCAEALGIYLEQYDYKDCADKFRAYFNNAKISGGGEFSVVLKNDGTVGAAGSNDFGETSVYEWTDIASVSAGWEHTVGLKKDGTVVATGDNGMNRCDVWGWQNIVSVDAGGYHTAAASGDGKAVACGDNSEGQCNVSEWTDIVMVSAGEYHTVGLKKDGTVVAVGNNSYNQCDVSGWTDIAAISTGGYTTYGIKKDGTVVAVGENDYGQCNVNRWSNVVAIASCWKHVVALKADGTVLTIGNSNDGQCNVSDWKNVSHISTGYWHTLAVKEDGTVGIIGYNNKGQCDYIN